MRADAVSAERAPFQGDLVAFESPTPKSLLRALAYIITGDSNKINNRRIKVLGDIVMIHVVERSDTEPVRLGNQIKLNINLHNLNACGFPSEWVLLITCSKFRHPLITLIIV